MKKLLSAVLAGMTLLSGTVAVFADDAKGLALAESSHLKLDMEKGYVDMIDGTITVAGLKAEFASDVTVKGADGAEKADDTAVATDDAVTAGDASLKALIYGDTDKNGKINVGDAAAMLKTIAKWETSINTDAADVDKNGKINLSDVSKLLKYVAKWDDISLGNVRWVFENTRLTAENESADLELYFESPLVKIARSNTTNTGENAYKMKLARNETESCQFLLAADTNMEGLTVELSPFEHEYGEGTLESELLIHYYYPNVVHTNSLNLNNDEIIEEDYFPEPLLPLADSFELTADRSQGFTVNVTAGKDTPAGMYKAVLSVRDSAGKEIKRANIYTYVWDFTLPDTPYSKSSFGMSGFSIYTALGTYDKTWHNGDDHKTHAEYYDYLLDYNINSAHLPYDLLDPRADAYMNDPRVTFFGISGENQSDPAADDPVALKARFEKVQSNELWASKGRLFYVDEPWGENGAARLVNQRAYLTELFGTDDYKLLSAFFNTMVDQNNNVDMLEFIKDQIDVYVPRSDGFMPNLEPNRYGQEIWTPRQAYNKYGENLPRIQALKDDPEKELWWYVCVDPPFPYPNLYARQQGVMNRVLWWQQFMFDVDGFLYWATQAGWDELVPSAYRPEGGVGFGDGLLFYYGMLFGRGSQPIAGWRLIPIRDGFDDFDYLRMAEELVGREEVMKIVHRITTGVTYVVEDADLMESLREEVAEIIVENQK